jgi:predicted dehydrogenase
MNSKLGVCIVGCGYMGQIHAERWSKVPEAQVVAVVDSDPQRAERLAYQYRLERYYLDYREAIGLPQVDVVSVCIPTALHAEVSIAAAETGKHVLCEKPMALTLEQADRMMAAAKANQVKLGVGFMRRHSSVVKNLRNLLAEGKFGRPVLYHASDVRELRPKREMHDAQMNGGPVIDMAVHLIDLWAYMFDSRAVSVAAQGLRLASERPEIAHIEEIAVDTATMVVKYASGDIGTFVVSWGLPPKVIPTGNPDQFYGPKGLGEATYNGNRQELRLMREGGAWETLSISHEDMYQHEVAAFARWVLMDESFPTQGEEGRLALQVALGALESIRTGQVIYL